MSYFEEHLPSNGDKAFKCRQYTVEDAIAISGMNPKLIERFTSKFLEVIQEGQDIIDPRNDMTIHDRKTLVFKYALSSLEDDALTYSEQYTIEECEHCGELHDFRLSMVDFQKQAQNQIRNHPAEILTEYQGQRLKITPKMGAHAETLERFGNNLNRIKSKEGEDSDEYQVERVNKELYQVLCQFTLVDETPETKGLLSKSKKKDVDPSTNAERDKAWLYSLPQNTLPSLISLIAQKQHEIKHGIDFTYTFQCPKAKEGEGRIASMLPFRADDLISRI
jgi:hypothetical protein